MYNKPVMEKAQGQTFVATGGSRTAALRETSIRLTRGAVLVIAAYIGVQMISDIASLQVVTVFGLALDAGTFIYPISFTLRDLAHRILGKRMVRWVVAAAAVINALMAAYFYLVAALPINVEGGGRAEWAAILTPVWRITAASILAELISELVDTEMYALYVRRFRDRHIWGRVVWSNAVSIPVDSLLFAFIAFYGLFPSDIVMQIFYGNVLIKFVVTLVSIPMIYLGKGEGSDLE